MRKRIILVSVLALAAAAQALAAETASDNSGWQINQLGFDLGVRPVGRFGKLDNINVPPGDMLIQGAFHYWYNHLIGAHALFAVGVENLTLAFGVGTKLNLLELFDTSSGVGGGAGGVATTSSTNSSARGIAAPILKNFMLFGSLELIRYGFKGPTPGSGLTYDPGVWAIQPGVGAQWYFRVSGGFASRLYLETSMSYMRSNNANYIIPFVALGFELK